LKRKNNTASTSPSSQKATYIERQNNTTKRQAGGEEEKQGGMYHSIMLHDINDGEKNGRLIGYSTSRNQKDFVELFRERQTEMY